MNTITYRLSSLILAIALYGCTSSSNTQTQSGPETETEETKITVEGTFTSIAFTNQSAIDKFGVIENVKVKDKDGKTLETHTTFPASQALFNLGGTYYTMKLSALDASEAEIFNFTFTNVYDVNNDIQFGYHNPPTYLTEATYITTTGQRFKTDPTIEGTTGLLVIEAFPTNDLIASFADEDSPPYAEIKGSFALMMLFKDNVSTEGTEDKTDPKYKVSFTEDVVPSFQTMKCTDCHNEKDKFGNFVLEGSDVYNSVLKVITKEDGKEADSLLLTKPLVESELTPEQLEESKQHLYKPFDSIEHSVYNMWKAWIEQGAKNN